MADFLNNSTAESTVDPLPETVELFDEMCANRRWFHAHPELGYEEFITAAKIAEILRSYGITEMWEQVGKTGIVAMIRGEHPGPCIGLRADIDGLPVQETAKIDYKSKHDGRMHACGHDGSFSVTLYRLNHFYHLGC